jgi:hypothetical protein
MEKTQLNRPVSQHREVREWAKPKKAEKSFMTLLDDTVIRFP